MRIPLVKQTQFIIGEGRQKLTTPIFISMENKITTKANLKKAHFIASTIHSSYPVIALELIVEVSSTELSNWGSDTIHEMEYHLFNIPKEKFYEKISFYASTVEIDSGDDENDYFLTLRFIFVGRITINEAEFIGIEFRNIIEEKIKGNYFIKYNQMSEISDLVITLTPLQLYLPNPSKPKILPNWLMELISEHSLKIVPSMFFKKGLHKNLNTSFI
jgi:hypothetical protein